MGSIKEHPYVWGTAGAVGFLVLIYWATSGSSTPAAATPAYAGPSDAAYAAQAAVQTATLQQQGQLAVAQMQQESNDLQTTTAGSVAELQARLGLKSTVNTNATALSEANLTAQSTNLANRLTASTTNLSTRLSSRTANLNIRSQAADFQAGLANQLALQKTISGANVHTAQIAASEQEAIAAGTQQTLQDQIATAANTKDFQVAQGTFRLQQRQYTKLNKQFQDVQYAEASNAAFSPNGAAILAMISR